MKQLEKIWKLNNLKLEFWLWVCKRGNALTNFALGKASEKLVEQAAIVKAMSEMPETKT